MFATDIFKEDLLKYVDFSYECWDRFITNNIVREFYYDKNALIEFVGGPTRNHFREKTKWFHSRMKEIASEHSAPAITVDKDANKLELANQFLETRRSNGFETGVICILRSLEWRCSWNYNLRFGLRRIPRRVYQYYIYVYDDIFGGPGYFKLNSYLPMQIEGYFNQHNWAERYLNKEGIDYEMYFNSFQRVDMDNEEFQELLDSLNYQDIQNYNRKWIEYFLPPLQNRYETFIRQSEYCSNIHFTDREFLKNWYTQDILRNYTLSKPDTLSFIFKRRIDKRYKGQFQTKIKLVETKPSLKVQYKSTQNKDYIKDHDLRTETTINNPSDFNLGKQDYEKLRELCREINRNSHLARETIDPKWIAKNLDNNPFESKTIGKKRFPSIDLDNPRIVSVMKAFQQKKHRIRGCMNKDVREFVKDDMGVEKYNAQQCIYDIGKLRAHDLVRKDKGHNRYFLTTFGELFMRLCIIIKDFIVTPFTGMLETLTGEITGTKTIEHKNDDFDPQKLEDEGEIIEKKIENKNDERFTCRFFDKLESRYKDIERTVLELIGFLDISVPPPTCQL